MNEVKYYYCFLWKIPIEDASGTTLENAGKKLCQMAKYLKINWDCGQKKLNFIMQQ